MVAGGGGEGPRGMPFSGHEVPVMQDESVLESCCVSSCLETVVHCAFRNILRG